MLRTRNILTILPIGKKHSILHESITTVYYRNAVLVDIGVVVGMVDINGVSSSLVYVGTDCEYYWEEELQFLPRHRLEVH